MTRIAVLLISLLLAQTACADTGRPAAGVMEATSGYPPIVLYTTSWCPHSKAAKKYLTERGIPFTNRDIETDPAANTEMHKRYGASGVPVIVIGNDEKVLKGFSAESLDEALVQTRKLRPK